MLYSFIIYHLGDCHYTLCLGYGVPPARLVTLFTSLRAIYSPGLITFIVICILYLVLGHYYSRVLFVRSMSFDTYLLPPYRTSTFRWISVSAPSHHCFSHGFCLSFTNVYLLYFMGLSSSIPYADNSSEHQVTVTSPFSYLGLFMYKCIFIYIRKPVATWLYILCTIPKWWISFNNTNTHTSVSNVFYPVKIIVTSPLPLWRYMYI